MATQLKESSNQFSLTHKHDIIFGNGTWGDAGIFNVSAFVRDVIEDWRIRYADGQTSVSAIELARRAVRSELLWQKTQSQK